MRLCAMLCVLTMLLSEALCKPHQTHPEDAMTVRNPDIDASWYTGRGIRPVGRYGRRVIMKKRHPSLLTCRVCGDRQSHILEIL